MRYVICMRNPLDVARSLEAKMGFSLEKGLWLWLVYTGAAIQHTASSPRTIMFPERWLTNLQQELERLGRFLDDEGLAKRADVKEGVGEVIERRLWSYGSSSESILQAHELYRLLGQDQSSDGLIFGARFRNAVEDAAAVAQRTELQRQRRERERWASRLSLAKAELLSVVPRGDRVIFVDDQECSDLAIDHVMVPFLERNGVYWGQPSDDAEAIREFERLRQEGARFLAFVWPTFWWLEHYVSFHRHLRARFRCVLQNDRLVIFDLRGGLVRESRESIENVETARADK
jgi:hypothetical protein